MQQEHIAHLHIKESSARNDPGAAQYTQQYGHLHDVPPEGIPFDWVAPNPFDDFPMDQNPISSFSNLAVTSYDEPCPLPTYADQNYATDIAPPDFRYISPNPWNFFHFAPYH